MNNFTFENQGSNTYLVYAIQPEDSIDSMSLGMLTNNKINGLTPAIFTQVDTEKYIKYNVSAKVSVKQFFSGPVNKKRLIGVFKGIVDAMFSAEEYMIDTDSILLDLEYIFSDVSSCDTSLICLPVIRELEEHVELGDFFKRIMFSTQFDQTENCDHVAKIINYLNSTPIFSLGDFSKVLDALQEEKATATVVQTIVVQKEETPQQVQPSVPVNRTPPVNKEQGNERIEVPVVKKVTPQPSVPEKKPEPIKNGEKEISLFYLLQHYNKDNAAAYKAQKEAKKEAKKGTSGAQHAAKGKQKDKKQGTNAQSAEVNFMIPGQENVTAMIKEPEKNKNVQPTVQPKVNNNSGQGVQVKAQESTAKENVQTPQTSQGGGSKNFGQTVVLNPSMRGETTVLSMDKNPTQMLKAYLVRTKNNENIILNKPIYRIGTERSYVDYFVSDNSAVSRGHANIVTRDCCYYVVDTNSRNHTFVNGEMISSNIEVQLEHGDIIRLANEEFEFKLH